MIFIFRNRTIFWDISKWNRGQKKWDGGNNIDTLISHVNHSITEFICNLFLTLKKNIIYIWEIGGN